MGIPEEDHNLSPTAAASNLTLLRGLGSSLNLPTSDAAIHRRTTNITVNYPSSSTHYHQQQQMSMDAHSMSHSSTNLVPMSKLIADGFPLILCSGNTLPIPDNQVNASTSELENTPPRMRRYFLWFLLPVVYSYPRSLDFMELRDGKKIDVCD